MCRLIQIKEIRSVSDWQVRFILEGALVRSRCKYFNFTHENSPNTILRFRGVEKVLEHAHPSIFIFQLSSYTGEDAQVPTREKLV